MSDKLGLMADNGYDALSLFPFAVRRSVMVDGPKVKLAMPQALRNLARALAAPKGALQGDFDPNSPEGVEEALNIGLMALGSGTAFNAGRAAPKGALATITTADRAPWATPIKPAGGKPGQNYVFMSDADFRIPRTVQDHLLEHGVWSGKLGQAAEGQVMKAHPEVWDSPTTLRLAPGKAMEGTFSKNTNEILASAPRLEAEIAKEAARRPVGRVPDTLESVLVHELGHVIQKQLEMQSGTSPDSMLRAHKTRLSKIQRLGLAPDEEAALEELAKLPRKFDELPAGPLKDKLFKEYLSTAGEENSRLAQKLMGLTDEQLAAGASKHPLESFYDVKPELQLVPEGPFGGLMRPPSLVLRRR